MSRMVPALLHDLMRHKAHASAALLRSIRQHAPAARDTELRALLHHIVISNRFWVTLCRGVPFAPEDEAEVPASLDAIAERYRETQAWEAAWLADATEADLERRLTSPYLPGREVSAGEALLQVCLHTHGHRAQCATRLRALGGSPPAMDFVAWLEARPAAGFGEETVNRGYLFERGRRLLGEGPAATATIVAVTSLLFGLAHYPAGAGRRGAGAHHGPGLRDGLRADRGASGRS